MNEKQRCLAEGQVDYKEGIAKRVLAKAEQMQYHKKFQAQVRRFERFRQLLEHAEIDPKRAEWEMVEIANKAEAYLVLSGR